MSHFIMMDLKRNDSSRQNGGDAFANLLFNVLLPIIILNQVTKKGGAHGATIALVLALAFPIGYGLYDLIKSHRKNWISVLGIVNILFTGGLALLNLTGFWFAVKEAAFPFIIGLGVFISAFNQRPLAEILFLNERVLHINLVKLKLEEKGASEKLRKHLKLSTLFLSGSFFFSSLLNFLLAQWIFTDPSPSLSELEKSTLLNDQIAQMTWLSFIVIAIPSMIILLGILWHLIEGIKKYTGLTLSEVIHTR